jgi:hypothetical protein
MRRPQTRGPHIGTRKLTLALAITRAHNCDLNHKMAVLNHNVASDSDTPPPKVNHPELDRYTIRDFRRVIRQVASTSRREASQVCRDISRTLTPCTCKSDG